MATKNNDKEGNKSGAGKFFLGAALGALAGVAAGKLVKDQFAKKKVEGADGADEQDEPCDEKCCAKGKKCDCNKEHKKAEASEIKASPKSSDSKTAEDKKSAE